jgi:glycosyltransferase involved in cell wall biosynthesis
MTSKIPVLIPTFNNPTHLRNMIAQLWSRRINRIIVVDNASTFPPMVDLLATLERRVKIIRRPTNTGPHSVLSAANRSNLPQLFCVTDPDIEFNPSLPPDFLERLAELTEKHQIGKAGFSLDISEPAELHQFYFMIDGKPQRIWEWEEQFWKNEVDRIDGDPVYFAKIDTTFALYNQAHFIPRTFLAALRVAGRFTAKHLPWYRKYRLPVDEADFYRAHSKTGAYVGPAIVAPAFGGKSSLS